MPRFRYKTIVVHGPWCETRRDAMLDAVRNGFAYWADRSWQEVTWRFPGEIEEREDD